MVVDNSLGDSQTNPGSIRLGGKKGVKDFIPNGLGDTMTVIGNLDENFAAF